MILSGLGGTGRGKAGAYVFSKGDNGLTVVKAYQPQVSNPKTNAQTLQRVKMVLCGKLSGLTPSGCLTGIGFSGSRMNRSVFLKTILNACRSMNVNGGQVALLYPEQIVFARGAQPLMGTVSAVTLSAGKVEITNTLAPGDLAGRYGERIIAVVLQKGAPIPGTDPTDNPISYDGVYYTDHIFSAPQQEGGTVSETIAVNFPQDLQEGQLVAVYRCPFILKPSTGSTTTGGFGANNLTTDAQVTAWIAVNSSSVKDWGASHMEGDVLPFVEG